MNPAQRARLEIREKRPTGSTRGLAPGYVQCNLAVVPQALAFDFLLYCQRNARACPVLEVCDPGSREAADIRGLWRKDLVAFLIGSGITFDAALERAGVPTDRHRCVLNSRIPT